MAKRAFHRSLSLKLMTLQKHAAKNFAKLRKKWPELALYFAIVSEGR